jgi:tRNA(fMet)-specific endonuclease VapC
MSRFLLDTDHVSLQERGDPHVRRRLESIPADQIAVCVVTVEEMLRGRLAILSRRQAGTARVHAYRKLLETIAFFNAVPVVPFDLACERTFQELRARKLQVGSQDLRIAATALVHDLTVVTRNQRDFARVPGLRLEDWSSA